MHILFLLKKISDSAKKYPEQIFTENCKSYTCINPYYYHIIRKNKDLYSQIDGYFIDGMTMCLWIKLIWGINAPRLSFDMTGIAKDLLTYLNRHDVDKTVFFIGSKQAEIEKSTSIIRQEFPNISNIFFRNGYFKDAEERNNVINNLVKTNPNFIIIGMGSPLQEKFAIDLKKAGYNGITFTCGGFLHQTTNSINYYPDWINKFNLRAFYRLTQENGLFKRLYNVLIEFPILFIFDSISTRLGKS